MLDQESRQDVVVTGVRFRPGRPGPQELTFNLRTFVEQVKVMVDGWTPHQAAAGQRAAAGNRSS